MVIRNPESERNDEWLFECPQGVGDWDLLEAAITGALVLAGHREALIGMAPRQVEGNGWRAGSKKRASGANGVAVLFRGVASADAIRRVERAIADYDPEQVQEVELTPLQKAAQAGDKEAFISELMRSMRS